MVGASDADRERVALVRGKPLSQQAYRQLAHAILSGAFAPGERVAMRRLAVELNVSVTPVRDAVLRLVSEGILRTTGRNAIILPIRTEQEVREIFEIRKGLEGNLAARAARQLDDPTLDGLGELQRKFLRRLAAHDYKAALRYNADFHFSIYRKADLPIHLKIVESLWLRIGPILRYMYPTLLDRRNHRRHEEIIACAKAHDASALRASVVADLETSEQAIYGYLRRRVAPAQPADGRMWG